MHRVSSGILKEFRRLEVLADEILSEFRYRKNRLRVVHYFFFPIAAG